MSKRTDKEIHGKDYDKEFDEVGFCRVLGEALDSGRGDMDLFDAAKLQKKDPDKFPFVRIIWKATWLKKILSRIGNLFNLLYAFEKR